MVKMFNIGIRLLVANFIWKYLCLKCHITKTTVILFLSGENSKIDEYALRYLGYVMERKRCDKAIVFSEKENAHWNFQSDMISNKSVRIEMISKRKIDAIYNWYRIVRFNKNIFFTYTDKTKDNMLGRFLRETDIDEKDAVCLAIYNLRTVLEEE